MANEECRLSFLTLNLWNDKEGRPERLQAFFNLVLEYNPDIICLQEVTNLVLQKIIRQKWSKMYFLSTKKIKDRVCGEVMLSKFPISLSETFPFKQTAAGNSINISHINIPLNYVIPVPGEEDVTGDCITIVNCQLEKLKTFSDMRKEQFRSLVNLFCRQSCVFYLGDTNFTDEETDSLDVPTPWKDSCVEMGEQMEFKNTYDSSKNTFINGHHAYRYDRIIYKSPFWNVEYFETVGMDELVSTHFGIYAEFTKRT
jgi:tyrosyl-DNA phosphodiesterase 2